MKATEGSIKRNPKSKSTTAARGWPGIAKPIEKEPKLTMLFWIIDVKTQ